MAFYQLNNQEAKATGVLGIHYCQNQSREFTNPIMQLTVSDRLSTVKCYYNRIRASHYIRMDYKQIAQDERFC